MKVPSYFAKFLREIRPTISQKDDLITGHRTLRNRLKEDEGAKELVITTFLQGSYRRATLIRPKGDQLADVDVVVVTNLKKGDFPNPNDALDKFLPFLKKYYSGKFRRQGRSFGIDLSYVSLDLVVTTSPSAALEECLRSAAVTSENSLETDADWRLVPSWRPLSARVDPESVELAERAIEEAEWKTEPLWIPDRDAGQWVATHPLEQIKWTRWKNARCNGHFVNVVKSIKWWQRINDDVAKAPSSYPLERLIGECCPDGIEGVDQGIVLTLETFVNKFSKDASAGIVSHLADHGVPEHNVLKNVTPSEFQQLSESIRSAAGVARSALDADKSADTVAIWRKLLGNKFPPSDGGDGGSNDPKGPFVVPDPKKATGDTAPRKYGLR